MMRVRLACAFALVCLLAPIAPAQADREPVLAQVDLPHSYYWRELYLPQLTTGPSSASFLPDGRELIYSMAGSLWRQRLGTAQAVELTHAAGAYDYQPDVARDGASVVFSRYDGRSIELWQLDLASGRERPLTAGGAVNVEPRLSPDGRQLAWVSTAGSGRFNLYVATLGAAGLEQPRPLIEERRSLIDRYYYSAFDHAINPSWSADGARLFYVGNPEVAWGSGDLWSLSVVDPGNRRRILSEETTWSARPELAPDGRRLLYSSYHGRQWQQLWLTTADGAAPLPLTFGEFDRRNARWSPDGERIAYISNEAGNTALIVQDVVGGAQFPVVPQSRRYRLPQARLTLDIRDEKGERAAARVALLGSDGRAHAPASAWVHADDGFDRARQRTETHYFHCAPPCTLDVPAGLVTVNVQRGFRYQPWHGELELAPGTERALTATLARHDLPEEFGQWLSADLHVHMNYGGHYRNTPSQLAAQARAEDLDVVYNLIVNKEERIPDVALFRPGPDPAGGDDVVLLHAQEFHTSFWGHVGLLHLTRHLLLPDFASYRHTALASPYPHNGVIADLAHAQGGLVGYVHPFDWPIVPAEERTLSNALPADVAHGKVDYLEIVGFSDHKSTAAVWYRLLNLGFRLAAGAGTDAMANYAQLRGPVGLNRVFLDTGGARTPAALQQAIKAGRSFVSNGPLLGLELDGRHPGDTVVRAVAGDMAYRVAMRSPVAVDHVELVANGRVIRTFEPTGDRRSLDVAGQLHLDTSGWLLLRAWNEVADPVVLDLYPYASTSPIYLELPADAPSAAEDAAYFVAWLDRVLGEAEARDDYLSEREKRATLDYLQAARQRFVQLSGQEEAMHP